MARAEALDARAANAEARGVATRVDGRSTSRVVARDIVFAMGGRGHRYAVPVALAAAVGFGALHPSARVGACIVTVTALAVGWARDPAGEWRRITVSHRVALGIGHGQAQAIRARVVGFAVLVLYTQLSTFARRSVADQTGVTVRTRRAP